MKVKATIAIIIWIITGVITAGASNAYFRGSYPMLYKEEGLARTKCGGNFVLGLFGPIGLVTVTFTSGFFYHGISFSCHAIVNKP